MISDIYQNRKIDFSVFVLYICKIGPNITPWYKGGPGMKAHCRSLKALSSLSHCYPDLDSLSSLTLRHRHTVLWVF